MYRVSCNNTLSSPLIITRSNISCLCMILQVHDVSDGFSAHTHIKEAAVRSVLWHRMSCSPELLRMNGCPSFRCILGKGNSLSHTLINDKVAYLCKTIYVCLSAPVVSTFYGVIKETIYRVVVSRIVLCCIDTSLCCN